MDSRASFGRVPRIWARAVLGRPGMIPMFAAPAAADVAAVSTSASLDRGVEVERRDGTFGARAGILVWSQWQAQLDREGSLQKNDFTVPIVRPTLRAFVGAKWMRLFVQPELAGAPKLLDLELDAQPTPAFGLKLGQMIPPFSRAFMTPVPKLQMPGFSPANERFRANRDVGAMAYGFLLGGRFEWFAGVFDGTGLAPPPQGHTELAYFVRHAATIVGPPPPTDGHVHYDETPSLGGSVPFTIRFGANAYAAQTTPAAQATTQTGPTGRAVTLGADAQVLAGGFMLQLEGYVRRTNIPATGSQTSWGGYVQAGQFLFPQRLEVAGRTSYTSRAGSVDPAVSYEGQLAFYAVGNHLKVIGRYAYIDGPHPAHAVGVHAQLWF